MYLPLGSTHEEGTILLGIIQFYELPIPPIFLNKMKHAEVINTVLVSCAECAYETRFPLRITGIFTVFGEIAMSIRGGLRYFC